MPVPVLEAASAEVGSSVNSVIMARRADTILVFHVFKVVSSLSEFRSEEADRSISRSASGQYDLILLGCRSIYPSYGIAVPQEELDAVPAFVAIVIDSSGKSHTGFGVILFEEIVPVPAGEVP